MSPTSDSGSQLKKRKKDRACDACRRRKTKCDGPWMLNNLCTNCIQSRKPCTYVEASKPRSPPKAYVTGLEDRLEALETLLKQVQPDVDFSEELGPPVIRNSWKTQEDPSSSASNMTAKKSSFAPHGLQPILIPFHSSTRESINSNAVASPPVSTHLMFHSQPRTRRPRILHDATLMSYRDGHDLSDEDSTTESASSSSDTEEIVITSIVGRTKITLRASENDDSAGDNNIRFHGRSSTAGLVETTRQFKYMHMCETLSSNQQPHSASMSPDNHSVAQTRRPQFWQTPFWEIEYEGAHAENPDIIQSFLRRFPPADLMEVLIDLYFQHSNIIFPLLHRPTFMRQWKERLHHRNVWFTCLCLSIFAIGSRWCRDERVLPEDCEQEGNVIDWTTAGLEYFHLALEIHDIRRSLFHPASLFEVQTINLMSIYMRGTSAHPTAWLFVSAGIRKAQDVGAHRKKVYQIEPNIDDELWKRAFWHLVVFDRLGSASLGRACGLAEEDFDLELPLEVDDDYWEINQSCREPLKQPPGIPSSVTAFNQYIKLTQIMAFALRTLYAIDRSKIYRGLIPLQRESLVKQLSIALDEWKEGLPEHLRWHEKISPLFSCQAATLLTTYHVARILVYRPLMTHLTTPSSDIISTPKVESAPDTPLAIDPAHVICVESARSCARIIEHQLQRGFNHIHVSNVIDASYFSAASLVLHSWNLKVEEKSSGKKDIKPPVAHSIGQNIIDIRFFLQTLENLRDRWGAVDSLLEELQESLCGLEGFESTRSYSQPQPSEQWSTTRTDHQKGLITPSPLMKSYQGPRTNSLLKNRHSIADLSSLSRTETGHISRRLPVLPSVSFGPTTQPRLPPSIPISRLSSDFDPVDSLLLFSGRSHASSVAHAVTLSSTDRTLPFISSMRRTSYPNLSSRENQHYYQGLPEPRISSETLPIATSNIADAIRYEDVNMHFNDEVYAVQDGYRQSSQTKLHGTRPYDRGYR